MNDIFSGIPLPNLKFQGEYDCGDGAYMLVFDGAHEKLFGSYLERLKSNGFKQNDGESNEAIISSVLTGKLFLEAYFDRSDKKIRLIADNKIPVYSKQPKYVGELTSSLWQFEVDHSLIDCGMCYIVRCDDGSFFIIDSAHYYSVNDDRRIIDFLRKVSGEEKPRVSGWFFSHAHEDHIGIFNDILKYHSDELTIEAVYYNFPSPFHRDAPWELPFFNQMCEFRSLLSSHREIRQIKLHTGMNFCIRNLAFNVLCTHEDVYPASTQNFNNTSTVIMMNCNGTKVLFPGDASEECDKILLRRYNESLKCDIIQIAHHGHSGLSSEFYKRAGGKCALFPVTVIKFDEEYPRQEADRIALKIADEYYIASNGTVEMPMPYKPHTAVEYPDETFEDFDGIFNLWGYEYSDERKMQLRSEYSKRSKKTARI